LTPNTTYYTTVYTYNNCGGIPDYLVTANLSQSFITISAANYYSSITTQSCAALKTALSNIINAGVTQLNYGSIDDMYHPTTDDHLNDAGNQVIVWDMYSDNPTGAEPYTYTFAQAGSSATAEGQGWNKEHTFPNSWFSPTSSTNNFPGADLHHIVPTDIYVNSGRGNLPYGIVGGTPSATYLNGSKKGSSATPIPGYSGEVFEPINAYKGDLARITLYMVTRYQAEIPTWENYQTTGDVVMDGLTYPSIEPAYLQMLLAWDAADPVSQKEIDRNEAVFGFQGNRNPFIDHPEWVNAIWGPTCIAVPVKLVEFTGTKKNESVILNWSVASETNFKQYDIERSYDGISFNKIGFVTGRNLANYSFDDNNPSVSGIAYYRLKMIDIDGNFTNSKTIIIKLNNSFSNAIIYPNPAFNSLNILLIKGLSSNSTLQVSDVAGRIIQQQNVAAGSINIPLNLMSFNAGRYIIRVFNSNETIIQSFVVIK
ncbi:MAG TPA: endonuclease, partial [Ferruginibacter sp.]|nr:endonuclease [Ferruginibacter sp.]